MKKVVSFILCLSVLMIYVAGVASADTITKSFKPDVTNTTTRVSTALCSASGKKGYYASIKMNAYGTFTRGSGLSNEGQKYTVKSPDAKTSANMPGQATGQVRAIAEANNALDYYTSGKKGTGTYTWRSVSD